MSFEEQVAEATQKAADLGKAKAQQFWQWAKTRGKAHAVLEWRRMQNRVFRQWRNLQEPPVVPKWMQKALSKADDGGSWSCRSRAMPNHFSSCDSVYNGP
jgi:hypothetical protein